MTKEFGLRTSKRQIDTSVLSFNEDDLFFQAKSSITKLPFLSKTSNWSSISSKKDEKTNIEVMELSHLVGQCRRYNIRSTTKIYAKISEVTDILMSNDEYNSWNLLQQLFSGYFLDGQELYTKTCPSEPSNKLSVKWIALHPKHPFQPNIDLCILDYSCIMLDDWSLKSEQVNPTPMFIRVIQSIDLAGLPSGSFSRRHLEPCGMMIRETSQKDSIEIRSVATHVEGILPTSLTTTLNTAPTTTASTKTNLFDRATLRAMACNIGKFERIVVARRLKQHSICGKTQWIPNEYRDFCSCCGSRFGFILQYRRRHHCRMCGEVVCGTCGAKTEVDLDTIGLRRIRVCETCIQNAKKEDFGDLMRNRNFSTF